MTQTRIERYDGRRKLQRHDWPVMMPTPQQCSAEGQSAGSKTRTVGGGKDARFAEPTRAAKGSLSGTGSKATAGMAPLCPVPDDRAGPPGALTTSIQ